MRADCAAPLLEPREDCSLEPVQRSEALLPAGFESGGACRRVRRRTALRVRTALLQPQKQIHRRSRALRQHRREVKARLFDAEAQNRGHGLVMLSAR